jgi:tRNA G18 (ribose-2'-O)-methylase SpoU
MSRFSRVSHDDPRVAAYMNVREKDLVGREGRFIAEGMNVVRVLVSARSLYQVESVLISEKREDAIAELGVPEDVPIYSLAQADMDRLTGFHIHRGVLAVGKRPPGEPANDGSGDASLVVALMGIVNHDNVGGIFRNAAAFGADLVVMDDVSCDPLYRKAIRVSVGGALTVPMRRFESAAAMLEWLQTAHFDVLALSPRGRERMVDVRREGKAAILLGPEGPGLPEELLSKLRTVRIPMSPDFDSLNVSVTSGIALSVLGARPSW